MSLAEKLREACAEQGISLSFEGEPDRLARIAQLCPPTALLDGVEASNGEHEIALATLEEGHQRHFYLVLRDSARCQRIATVFPDKKGSYQTDLLETVILNLKALAAHRKLKVVLPAELECAASEGAIQLLHKTLTSLEGYDVAITESPHYLLEALLDCKLNFGKEH